MTESIESIGPTAEQIIEQGRRRRIKEVTYCGGTVHVHGQTRTEARAYRNECVEAAGSIQADEYRDERLIMHMVRDRTGKRIFSEAHLTQLANMNEADFAPLFGACAEVNGWTAAATEEIRKNSGTRSGASGSGSPPTGGSAAPTQ